MTERLWNAWLELKECSDWECENGGDHPEYARIYPAFEEAILNDPEGLLELIRCEDLDDLETIVILMDAVVEKDPTMLRRIRHALHGESSRIIEGNLLRIAHEYGIEPV